MLKPYQSIYKEMAIVGPSYKGLTFKVYPRNHGKENFQLPIYLPFGIVSINLFNKMRYINETNSKYIW
jgi:hypothetical protein